MPRALLFLLLTLLALLSVAYALSTGSVALSGAEVVQALTGSGGEQANIVLDLRLPRALAAFAVGGLLALAGALMQILLRNPLADPYVLGVSGGAGVGAMTAFFFGLAGLGVDGAAFLGAMTALFLVFGLARGDGSWTQARLLLTGVMVAAGCGALITLMLSIAPEPALRGMLFWLMGDLGQADQPVFVLLLLVITNAAIWPFARELNLLCRGDQLALALGVRVRRLRWGIYFLAALATSGAVTQAGSIGFIGLVVPHGLRLMLGNDQRLLLPAVTLVGGALLVFADTLARTLIAPQQLPVGVLTALIGVPLFLLLLNRPSDSGGEER